MSSRQPGSWALVNSCIRAWKKSPTLFSRRRAPGAGCRTPDGLAFVSRFTGKGDDMDILPFVEPDRVHRRVYTDQTIFDAEMEKIWERTWVYCGHLSQIPKAGDYYAVTIGRQPMIMVRQGDGGVQVLYNRCPHRGVQLVGNLRGND